MKRASRKRSSSRDSESPPWHMEKQAASGSSSKFQNNKRRRRQQSSTPPPSSGGMSVATYELIERIVADKLAAANTTIGVLQAQVAKSDSRVEALNKEMSTMREQLLQAETLLLVHSKQIQSLSTQVSAGCTNTTNATATTSTAGESAVMTSPATTMPNCPQPEMGNVPNFLFRPFPPYPHPPIPAPIFLPQTQSTISLPPPPGLLPPVPQPVWQESSAMESTSGAETDVPSVNLSRKNAKRQKSEGKVSNYAEARSNPSRHTCHNCGEIGHLKGDCPYPQGWVYCYGCRQASSDRKHVKKNCHLFRKESPKSEDRWC